MKKILVIVAMLGFVLAPLNFAQAAPLVKLTSPNGGEKFSAGKSMQIKWTSSMPKEAQINATLYKLKGTQWDYETDFYQYVENSYPVYLSEYTNTGSTSWNIPYNQPAGNYVIEFSVGYSEQFSNQYGVAYSAKPFQITAGTVSTTGPKITNIQPNPVYTGESVTITGTGFKENTKVFMKPLGSDSYGYFEIYNPKQTGSTKITFSLEQYVTAGSYEVYVENSSGTSEMSGLVVAQPAFSPFPLITNITPDSGVAGTTITLTGTNFAEENEISYYSNYYGPYPLAEDQTGDSEDSSTSDDSSDDSTMSDDSKYIYPPYNNSGVISGVKSQNNGTTLQFKLPEDVTTTGIYTINVSNSKGYSDEAYFTLVDPASQNAHPAGTNIKGPDGTIYFIDGGNTRMPYTSAGAFLSYKFNSWDKVVPANTADMNLPLAKYVPLGSSQETVYFAPPRSGSLFKDKGTVYLISNGQRTAFTSAKSFLDAGYSFSNVQQGDTSFMVTLVPFSSPESAHPDGTLVNDNGTIYVMKNGYKMGFPTVATLASWGYSASEIVPANANDRNVQTSGILGKRNPSQLNI